jgi:hypothetical protein
MALPLLPLLLLGGVALVAASDKPSNKRKLRDPKRVLPPGMSLDVMTSKIATPTVELPSPAPAVTADDIRQWIAIILKPAPEHLWWDDEASVSARARKNNILASMMILDNLDPVPTSEGWDRIMGLWDMLWHAISEGYFVTPDMTGEPIDQRYATLEAIFVTALANDLIRPDATERLNSRWMTLNNMGPLEVVQAETAKWEAMPHDDPLADAVYILGFAFDHALAYDVPAELKQWAEMSAWELIARAVVQIGVSIADAYTGGAASQAKTALAAAAGSANNAGSAAQAGNMGAAATQASAAVSGTKGALAKL